MITIGVDIGTTTISLVAYDVVKEAVETAVTIPNGCFLTGGPEWEKIQDAKAIVRKAKNALDELLNQYPNVSAIGLTGQMHGILYVDQAGGAVSPLYTWQDGRGDLPEFGGESVTEWIKKACKVSASTGYGLVTHCYQLKKKLVPENAAGLCTIADYFGMALTGRRQPILHASMAASLGFYDIRKGGFQKKALEAAGIDPIILPEVTGGVALLGYYREIPVLTALGDSQASFLGAVGIEENTVLVNMGTGGQVSVLSDHTNLPGPYFETVGTGSKIKPEIEPKIKPKTKLGFEARPFLSDGTYLFTGASLCGGRAYAILERFFREYAVAAGAPDKPQYEKMEELAKAALGKGGMDVVTTFNGTRADPSAKGSVNGISEENFTPGALILGVLTGMARELYELYDEICKSAGIRARRMVASGNGLRKNQILRQIFQDLFQMKLELSRCEEEAACGAAVSGAMWVFGRKGGQK